MDRFTKFDMVIMAPPQLKMWHDNLDGDHRRTLDKYMGALKELINMNGWLKLVKVLTGYWDRQRIVFRFRTTEITQTLEEIRDRINSVGTDIESKERKQKTKHLHP